MHASPDHSLNSDNPLQLLLFVDKRPSSREQVRRVRSELKELREVCDFELQIIDVTEQPYLAEYFRLIATPALIKLHPEPRQTLAGSDMVGQLRQWWHHWQRSVNEYLAKNNLLTLTEAKPEKALLGSTNPMQSAEVTPVPLPIADRAPEVSAKDLSSLDSTNDYANPVQSPIKSVSQSVEQIRVADQLFELAQENKELRHQLQFKDQIISMLAHDLRNPLTATSIALETLEMAYTTDASASRLTPALMQQLLKHARTQTRAIDRMITDILQAARGTSAELKINPQRLNLAALCLDVLAHMRDRLQAKTLHLHQDIPSDLPTVLADEERIRQVLLNLLDNAVKYTPIGGTIQISALHRTTQKIQISICDTGPGIPLENQAHIFEEHYRLKRDEDKEGYGIGLSLCQRIIRAHYGRIWVDSTPNQGSCFHFTLPVCLK